MINEQFSNCRLQVVVRRLPSPTSWVHMVLIWPTHGFEYSPAMATRRQPLRVCAKNRRTPPAGHRLDSNTSIKHIQPQCL